MATTSLWHIKGRLKDLIDYVENPEKTASKMPELQDLYNVFSYVQRPEATQEGDYVTALNCLKETALRQMILTKKRYGKTDGYIAWHGYQSFKPEEMVGKKVIIVANLKPRQLRGMESKGMILFADNGERVEIVSTDAPDGEVVS